MTDEVLLIDLSGLAHMTWHVSQSDPDANATSRKVVERIRAMASNHPHTVVCLDVGRSFRKDLDPTYKAGRPEPLATLNHQIDVTVDILRGDGFPCLGTDGFEADDTIATLTKHLLATSDVDIKIVSADKDLVCLTESPRVRVMSIASGNVIDAAAVEAKFGVRPDQMLDFLALCGDASDNIKGCEGVGKVRAADLLRKFGTIDNIYSAPDGYTSELFTKAMKSALDEFKPRLEAVRLLLRLRTDAPIDIEPLLKERMPLDVAEFGADVSEEVMTPADYAKPTGMDTAGSDTTGAAVKAEPSAPVTQLPARANGTFTLQADTDPAPIEFERQLEPRNMQQMKALAADLFASRLFSAYGHPAGVMSTVLAGRELGLPAMASLRAFHVIDGKPCLAADFIRALVLRSGVVEYFRCTERTPERATFVAKRKGDPEISLTFTIQDGRTAWQKTDEAWTKSGWTKNPSDMLIARAGAKLARLVAPDVVSGLFAPEEFE